MTDSLTSEVWEIGPAEVLVRRRVGTDTDSGSNPAFLSALARTYLTDQEFQTWQAMNVGSSRKQEWLHGRLVLKDVARAWARDIGHQIGPKDLEIRIDPAGAPFIRSAALAAAGGPPVVSLTHTSGLVVAAVSDPGSLLGIDVEHADRRVEVVARALNESETRFVRAGEASVLDLLVAKEAATKALGVGLGGGISRWPVIAASRQDAGLLAQVSSSTDVALSLSVLIVHESDTVIGICYVPNDNDAA